jgi:hypothetical protein
MGTFMVVSPFISILVWFVEASIDTEEGSD